MESTPHKSSYLKLVQVIDRDGIRAGIIYLNSLTSHRFTSLYRFDRDTLHNLFFYDRKNPSTQTSDEIPVISSYCVYVRDSGSAFQTDDSSCDPRVSDHPKRQTIKSYCGVPLIDRHGKMFGTVCHYDVEPRETDPAQIELLERVADLLLHRLPLAS